MHLYLNHIEQAKTQISREPKKSPQMIIKDKNDILDFKFNDFELIEYDPHPHIKAPIAV